MIENIHSTAIVIAIVAIIISVTEYDCWLNRLVLNISVVAVIILIIIRIWI